MLLQVAKMSEELVPDPPDFRVYISPKTGSVGGCSGPKTSRLGLRNLGLGSEGILIYTLGGVFGGFQGKKTTTFWTPKSTLRTPSSHPLDGGVLDPNRPNPKRSGEVSVLYPAVTASSAIRTDSIPSSLVRTPWDPLRTPPGGPSWIFRDFALLALWPIYRKPPKPAKS